MQANVTETEIDLMVLMKRKSDYTGLAGSDYKTPVLQIV